MAWFDTNWQYRIKFTIDSDKIDDSLSDFPVLVKLSSSNFDFSDAQSSGADIRFTASDGTTLLKFERERHDSINELAEYNVKVPSVDSGTDTYFYMYFGNSAASDAEDAQNVWDNNFLAVYHMSDLTSTTIEDSTANNNDGTKLSSGNPNEVDGEIYKAQDFSSDYINLGDIDLDGNCTIEALINPDSFGSTYGNTIVGCSDSSGLSSKADFSLMLSQTDGEVYIQVGDNSDYQLFESTLALSIGSWQYIAGKADGTNLSAILGVTKQTVTQTKTPTSNNENYMLGRMGNFSGLYYDGKECEIRISNIARSDAWLKATKETLFDTLLTYGAKETLVTVFCDTDTDIRVKFQEYFKDLDTDIRTASINFEDIAIDIRTKLEEHFKDIDTDVRVSKLSIEDLDTDIRVTEQIFIDLDTDIRVSEFVIEDVDTDIRVSLETYKDLDTDIRVVCRIEENQVVIEDITIDEGYYIATNTVTLNLSKVFGATQMQFKNETGSWSTLETFADSKIWNLTSGDGDKMIFARFMDIHGNLSDGTDLVEAKVTTSTQTGVTIEAYTDETATVPISDSTYQNDKTPFFRWSIPVSDIPYYAFSYALDAEPSEELVDLYTGNLVRTGLAVVKVTPTPPMTIKAEDGYYYYNSDLKEFSEQQITLDDGGVLDRIDLVYISGLYFSLNVKKGDEAVSPVAPDVPEDAVELATAYVPAGTTDITNVTLTDIRRSYIELNEFLTRELSEGQHYLKVRSFNSNGLTSDVSIFNIWVSSDRPSSGEILCYDSSSKIIQFSNGIYQTSDNTPYFEWTVATAQPGPIRYYYTEDGTEPDIASSYTTNNYLEPGTYPTGITILKVKSYDVTSTHWGDTREFVFIYGTETFTDDTVVISGTTVLKQSLKEIQVQEIAWNFDSARTCKIRQPVEFDETLPFSEGDAISVVYGGSNTTVFRGKIYKIERVIEEDTEYILYDCVGPRGELAEEYAYIINPDFGESAQITFDETPINTAIDTIVSKYPKIVKNIYSYPTGADITTDYVAQTVEQVLNDIYGRTKYGWYIKPDGSLVSIDSTAINPGQAKFGVYGTTVNAISPQFNVMGANLQFDVTKRYNTVIIEGANKRERVNLGASCGQTAVALSGSEDDSNTAKYKVYEINSEWPVVKLLNTTVAYTRAKGYFVVPIIGDAVIGNIVKFRVVLTHTEVCRQNKVTVTKREVYRKQTNSNLFSEGYTDGTYLGFPIKSYYTESQGSLGPNNTIRFGKAMYSEWPIGISRDIRFGFDSEPGLSIETGPDAGSPAYVFKDSPKKGCASVAADCIIETVPLVVTVNVPGTASGIGKILRVVNTDFKYDEDPDNLVDDTTRMIEYGEDLLQKYKDIKVTGTITLDTIDLTWDLDKTVNLINTGQASWTTLNAKVIGITYNFDENTTTLEITSEFLK